MDTCCTHVFRDGLDHGRLDESWADAVDPDAELRQLLGRRLGEGDNSSLGRSVVCLAPIAGVS